MFKEIECSEALEKLVKGDVSDLAYLIPESEGVISLAYPQMTRKSLADLLKLRWMRRVEPMRKVIAVGGVSGLDKPGHSIKLSIDVTEFIGRKIQVIVEEVD